MNGGISFTFSPTDRQTDGRTASNTDVWTYQQEDLLKKNIVTLLYSHNVTVSVANSKLILDSKYFRWLTWNWKKKVIRKKYF